MSREIRQMNIAGMSDDGLAAMRESIARAISGGGDYEHLLEDLDAEIARRVPAGGISREALARMTGGELADLRRAMEADMAGMTDPGHLAFGRASLASIDAELSLRTKEPS